MAPGICTEPSGIAVGFRRGLRDAKRPEDCLAVTESKERRSLSNKKGVHSLVGQASYGGWEPRAWPVDVMIGKVALRGGCGVSLQPLIFGGSA